MKIWDLPTTEEGAIEFLQDRGLLPKNRQSYFAEFMWRKMFGDGDVFEEVMLVWRKYWPCEYRLRLRHKYSYLFVNK